MKELKKPNKQFSEAQIQKKIIKQQEARGYYVVKLIKTNKNGIPDLLCFNSREFFFIEVKSNKGVLSELQKFRIKEIESYGISTFIQANETR